MNKNKKASQEKKKKHSTYQSKENVPQQKIEPIAPQRLRVESSDSDDDAPDFDYLLSLPPSAGSHFLLKSEIERFNQDTDLEFSKYFHLDTNLLNMAIKSIPFNERLDISDVEWNSTELQKMQDEASRHSEKYREALERSQLEKKESLDLFAKPDPTKTQEEPKPCSNNTNISKPTRLLEEEPHKEKESMQEWLDDILEL